MPPSTSRHAQLRATLTTRCAKRFEARQLHRLLRWLGSVVLPWLRLVLQPTADEGAPDSAALEHWHARLRFVTMQSLASLRISELFDLVVDWPESLPALDDLNECLRHTREHSRLVVQLLVGGVSALFDDTGPSARLLAPKAQAAAALPRAPPGSLARSPWPQPRSAGLSGS